MDDLSDLFDPIPEPEPEIIKVHPVPSIPIPEIAPEPEFVDYAEPEPIPPPQPRFETIREIDIRLAKQEMQAAIVDAHVVVENKIIEASTPAIVKMTNLLEAKKTMMTKDGDVIEVPDPKVQFQAAKDLLDRAGHMARQRVDITSNGESIGDLYQQMMQRRKQAEVINVP